MQDFDNQCSHLVWVWLVFMVTALSFAMWTPPFMFPDESTYLAGCMESQDPLRREALEKQILLEMDRHLFWQRAGAEMPEHIPHTFYQAPMLRVIPTQFAKPTTFYLIAHRLLALFNVASILNALFLLRLLSVAIAGVAVAIQCRIAREVFRDPFWQSAVVSAVAVPQYVYMSGALNPSNLAWVSGGMITLASFWLLVPSRRNRGYLLLAAALLLTLLTHRAALALVPGAAVAMLVGHRRGSRGRHQEPSGRWMNAGVGLLIGGISAGCTVFLLITHPLVVRSAVIRLVTTFYQLAVEPSPVASNPSWWLEFASFFWRGTILFYGWLSQDGPVWIYGLYGFIACGAGLGWLGALIRWRRPMVLRDPWHVALLWIFIGGMMWAGAGQYGIRGHLSQGRYLFAAWPVFGIGVAAGWSYLVPQQWHRVVAIGGQVVMWMVAAVSLWWVWIPGMYF
ncbi:hypothetical protein JXA80_00715 [bacterium]|nr:hypothetical protein [candidate division CSSED10-310 bacterium]